MNDNCVRARGWLAQWADGELAAAQTGWMENHWDECAACRSERDRFRGLDARLRFFGENLGSPADSTIGRVRFLARLDEVRRERRNPLVLVRAAALLAAAAALAIWLPRPAPRAGATNEDGFVAVPYVSPIASYERSSVISMQIPVANLLAEGYSVAADPSSTVQADVLLGEDGRVHAVRLAANQVLKGTGD